jgi:transcriptional regulator with XRE-family HTH domain
MTLASGAMTHLEYERRRQGMTQIDLSWKVRIAQYYISALERGVASPPPAPDQLRRLSAALDCPIELLLKPVEKLVSNLLPTDEAEVGR